jgi:hypothetical protein
VDGCGEAVHLVRRPPFGLLYQLRKMGDDDSISRRNEWQEKPKYSEKTCTSATLSTINPTGLVLMSNPGHLGRDPVTIRVSYDIPIV